MRLVHEDELRRLGVSFENYPKAVTWWDRDAVMEICVEILGSDFTELEKVCDYVAKKTRKFDYSDINNQIADVVREFKNEI